MLRHLITPLGIPAKFPTELWMEPSQVPFCHLAIVLSFLAFLATR